MLEHSVEDVRQIAEDEFVGLGLVYMEIHCTDLENFVSDMNLAISKAVGVDTH
jgi:hypothetical protein